ncbi:MAG: NAD(P)-dependent oxidoreductase [Alphaproteobacteria bacterium]|nr:NAD(P)-dependent oxidoreductase [Alphaproteobacteria bacterium]
MSTVAVLGMGLLGSGFAENLIAKGHTVRVWNRTASKCAPLAALGATVADTPADAVRGADRVHLVLAEDPAVDAVIGQLLPALGAGVPIVDHSTNLPDKVADRHARLTADGVRYVPAPVFMGPANARDGSGLMLVAGPLDDALNGALSEMTGKVWHVGDAVDRAAALKLTGNGMLIMLGAVMGDLFHLVEGAGLGPDDVFALLDTFKPNPAWLGKRVLAAGSSPASFELTMARKDVRLMIETAGGPERLSVLPGVAASMDAAIAAGHGADDFAIFAKR